MKKIRNIFSILLAVIMLVGLVPTNIFAGGVHLAQAHNFQVLK